MLHLLQLVRYIAIILSIFLILIQNPKANGMNTWAQTTKYLASVRNTESLLNKITWLTVLTFLVSTIFLASLDSQ